jgi:hypothetical protein
MRYLRIMPAVVGLFIAGGAIAPSEANDDKRNVTLYTPRLHGDHFNCQVVNVSQKPLGIAITVLDDKGKLLVPLKGGDTNPTQDSVPPGTVLGADFLLSGADDGYCEVAVSGTGNRDDVRVNLGITLTRTIPGTSPPVPVFLFRDVEGH